ncbi:MAG: ParB/RepB/Spo0J family partition protein, partial [Waterburya sp.]
MGKDVNTRQRPTRREMYAVPFENLRIIDDYNVRYDYGDIKELASSIAENGIKVPLRGYKEGDLFYITSGHRRYKAMQLLDKKGYTELNAPFIPEARGYGEEQRTVDLILTNDGKKLTMLEEAEVVHRLMNNFGKKMKEVAKQIGKSVAHVDNCLLLLSAPDDLKE